MKWQNAAPIANNPYSSEKLQRRLSETNRQRDFDIRTSQIIESIVEDSDAKNNEGFNPRDVSKKFVEKNIIRKRKF
jgi:hypothetical protein